MVPKRPSLYSDTMYEHLQRILRRLFAIQLVRFFVAGSTGAFVLLGGLYVLHGIFGLWVIASSAIAFCFATTISFILQKFWTFSDRGTHKMKLQYALFMTLAVINLGINLGIMYILTAVFGLWYLLPQAITPAILPISS